MVPSYGATTYLSATAKGVLSTTTTPTVRSRMPFARFGDEAGRHCLSPASPRCYVSGGHVSLMGRAEGRPERGPVTRRMGSPPRSSSIEDARSVARQLPAG